MGSKLSKPLPKIPLSKLLPSIITLFSLCFGLTSIRYSLDGKWTIAAMLILASCVMDGIDGRLARLLNATSTFGAHLDSLADIVSFGVAPALVVYFWSLHGIPFKGVGWAVVLFYISCSALRLARFNTSLEIMKDRKKFTNFFTGLPMPAAGFLAILPLMTTFEIAPDLPISYWFISFYLIAIGVLMISFIPIYSFKDVSIKRELVPGIMAILAFTMAALVLEPWFVLPLLGYGIILLIPISWLVFRRINC